MILQVFAIRDLKMEFRQPFFAFSSASVIRELTKTLKSQSEDSLVTNPEDFQLFKVGEFDTTQGMFLNVESTFILNVNDLKDSTEMNKA